MSFSLRYPPGWKVLYVRSQNQVSLGAYGNTPYSMTVTLLAARPAGSIEATTSRIVAQQRRIGNAVFARIQWSPVSLGGEPAMAGVARPPKVPGGITLSSGIYLTQSRSHVYQIVILSYGKRPLSSISQFPGIYRQILNTLRFM